MHPSSRRTFLRHAASGGAALALAPNLLFQTPPKEKLGVALVGLGYYSTNLLAPALQLTKHCYLAGVVSGSKEKAEKWQKQYQFPERNIYNYDNFDQIANNPDIDVVYVVLPNTLHRQFVERAARAGKQVWCEKPMAPTVADCEAMIKACKDNKVQLMIGYRMQHEPNTQEFIKMGKEKPVGKIRLVTAAAGFMDGRTQPHWRQLKSMSGGALFDMGVYSINAARYATGEEPIAVTAQQFVHRPELYKGVDETMLFNLEFPSGAMAQCSTSFYMNLNTLEVNAEKGSYKLSPFQSYTGVKGSTSWGKMLDAPIDNQQAKQMDDNALAIMNKTAALVPGEEGLRDIRVVEAIFKSAEKGKRVLI